MLTGSWTLVGHNNREKWCGVAVGQRQVTGEKTKKQKKKGKVKKSFC